MLWAQRNQSKRWIESRKKCYSQSSDLNKEINANIYELYKIITSAELTEEIWDFMLMIHQSQSGAWNNYQVSSYVIQFNE